MKRAMAYGPMTLNLCDWTVHGSSSLCTLRVRAATATHHLALGLIFEASTTKRWQWF